MSLFSDIISGPDGVYTLTNRPDLVAETALAVRQATLAAHRCDYFRRDIQELLISPGSANLFQLSISSLFANWRNFAYIRPYDSIGATPASFFLEPMKPDAILDEYLIEKTNVYYVAGDNLNIRLGANYDSFLVGYYSNPVLTPDASYESWIARQQSSLIVIDASKRVLEAIGYLEAANKLGILLYGPAPGTAQMPTGGEYLNLKMSEIEDYGR